MKLELVNNELDINQVTAIVSTHERPDALNNLVTSFRTYYPNLQIIAVDSSNRWNQRNDIIHLFTEDLGISKQRNLALDLVKTQLFLLLDDDFICTGKTNLFRLMDSILNWKSDISWWAINNIWTENYNFHWVYEKIWDTLYHFVDIANNAWYYDTIFNFFIWKTFKIKEIGGRDENLKYAREHDDFFLWIKSHWLLVSYEFNTIVDHLNYQKFHWWKRWEKCIKEFCIKWWIKNKVEIRLIKREWEQPYISYYNCISKQSIDEEIKQKIIWLYWDYPIIIS